VSVAALRRISWRHPEGAAAGIAALAWALLLIPFAGGGGRGLHTAAHDAMPLAAGAAGWLVMATAMMLPATLPAARDLALGALWSRRQRTVAIFAAAYVGVWAAFGAVAYTIGQVRGAVPGISAATLLPAVLLLAALWELTAWKWRAVRSCHLITPLPPRGGKADAACVKAGLRYGWRCVAACWPLMLAMAIVGHSSLGLMALLTAVVVAEKLAARPGRLAFPVAAILAGAALTSMAG